MTIDFLYACLDIGLIALLSLLPISLWFLFFQHKYKQPKKHLALSFLAGMLSVLPIKLYEKFWGQALLTFENINLFEKFADLVNIPTFNTFLAFILLSALVSLGLFLFTGFLMFFLEVLSGDNTIKAYRHKVRKMLESPFLFVSVGIISGLLAYSLSLSIHEKIWFFVIVGMLEEYIKYLVLRFTNEESIHRIRDALGYAVVVALGFAYVENILYFLKFIEGNSFTGQFWVLFVLRSTISVTAHVCFSAILAYFYGLAHFSKEIYQYDLARNKKDFLYWVHQMLHVKGSVLFHEQMMMEGMILAMFLHAAFNSLLEFERISLAIALLIAMFISVLYLYRKALFVTEKKVCPVRKDVCLLPQNLLKKI